MSKLRDHAEEMEGANNSMKGELEKMQETNKFQNMESKKTENLIKKMDKDLKKQVETKNKMREVNNQLKLQVQQLLAKVKET